jgi:hypothetical protein
MMLDFWCIAVEVCLSAAAGDWCSTACEPLARTEGEALGETDGKLSAGPLLIYVISKVHSNELREGSMDSFFKLKFHTFYTLSFLTNNTNLF